jgi:hypothetical protein
MLVETRRVFVLGKQRAVPGRSPSWGVVAVPEPEIPHPRVQLLGRLPVRALTYPDSRVLQCALW